MDSELIKLNKKKVTRKGTTSSSKKEKARKASLWKSHDAGIGEGIGQFSKVSQGVAPKRQILSQLVISMDSFGFQSDVENNHNLLREENGTGNFGNCFRPKETPKSFGGAKTPLQRNSSDQNSGYGSDTKNASTKRGKSLEKKAEIDRIQQEKLTAGPRELQRRVELPPDIPPSTNGISLKRLTEKRKFGVVPAEPGDGSDIWDTSELLELQRQRIVEAKKFSRRRRRAYALKLLKSCRSLRKKHNPQPPEMTDAIKQMLPKELVTKYNRLVADILQELKNRTVNPVILAPLGKSSRVAAPCITRVPWIPKERLALSRAMASFPPVVRTVMAEVLRPLHTYSLVDVLQASSIGVGEGLDIKVLVTSWKGMARKSRQYLRQEWFQDAVNRIREAATDSGLSSSRRHAVIYCFNNLLASKLQQVLIRSVEGFLSWLGSEEEPWIGPRIKIDLALIDEDLSLLPDEEEVYEAFLMFFEELNDCVQLYRATWDEPQPPAIPRWRKRLAEEKHLETNVILHPLRPIQPHRETLTITLSENQWCTLKAQARESLNKAYQKARQYLQQIGEEFEDVLSGTIKEEIEQFMRSGANLQEFTLQIKCHSKKVEEASHIPASATVTAFRLEYKPLRHSLITVCNNFVSVLRQKLINDHRATTKRLRNEFEKIAVRMQEIPKTTEQLFTLMEAVEEARRITIRKLNDEVVAMSERLQTILDVVLLTEEDLVSTAEVMRWPLKIKPIIERSVGALEDFKQQFEESLGDKTSEAHQTLERIGELENELEELGDVTKVHKYLREVNNIRDRLEKVESLVEWVNQEESLFKFPLSAFPELKELKKNLIPYEELFILVLRWRKDEKHWMDGDFTALDPEFIDLETEELARDLFALQMTFKAKFKQQAIEGDPKKARMNLDDPNPANLLGPLRVTALALEQIRSFKEHLPLVSVLCNKGLRPRHWVELNKVAGFDITPNAGTSLRKVVKMNLDPLLKQFEIVSGGASREFNLETSLKTMRLMWKSLRLKFIRHEVLKIDVLEGLGDLSTVVEEHLIKTHAIKNSPYVGSFRDEVSKWEATLRHARRNVREWLKVQSLWIELSPLFAMADLPSQLPKENKSFKEIDAKWKEAMNDLINNDDMLNACSDVSKLPLAADLQTRLEQLQQAVHSYLHNKRSVFPRLFFVSNEELTSLVCEKDSSHLGKHLTKCFDGIRELTLNQELQVEAIVSEEGEVINLLNKLSTKHAQLSIENWLLEFQMHLNQTMKHKMGICAEWWAKNCSGKRLTRQNLYFILNNFPLQITLTIRQAFLTTAIHEAIRGGHEALQQCLHRVEGDLKLLVETVRGSRGSCQTSDSRSLSRSSVASTSDSPVNTPREGVNTPREDVLVPSNPDRALMKGLVTTLILAGVHSRDLLRLLLDAKIEDEGAFLWLSQLRFFLTDGPSIEAKLLEVSLPWGWEYVGASGRLVATPLTSRAQMALAIAFKSHLGAANEGPAGTGKTETVKDLARILAMHCIVFNCSESVDSKGVALLLTGLAAAGSWLCLDEFNKFQVGVLSVAAQQLLTIISARRAREPTFSLAGMLPLALDPRGLMVVTLNPEYKGRVAIPDNLTLLLRPVAMLAADEQSIVEVWLMATGFSHANALGRRATRTLTQCRIRLDPHSHYDFGLRTVRSVLTTAGRLREAFPDCTETEIIIRALREVNQPKLVGKDALRFEEIIQDFFPLMPATPRPPEEDLRLNFRKICEERGVYVTKEFESKTFQLYSTLSERTGILLVGEACSSKSTILQTLCETLKITDGKDIYVEVLNPKTITQDLLVGHLDPGSRDWTDGKMTIALRKSQKQKVWILLDGPADASWVEQFNTALDDSKRLCLSSGETLSIPANLSIIFEVMDLSQASPAAVSRCGVVYVSESCISWRVLFHKWKNGFHNKFTKEPWWSSHVSFLELLVEWIIPQTETFLKINCRHVLPLKFLSLVRPVFHLTASLVQEVESSNKRHTKDKARMASFTTMGAFFFAFAWCVGGALDVESKERFSTFFRRVIYGEDKTVSMPCTIEKLGGCPYPSEGNIFEAAFDASQRSFWRPWNDVIKHMPSSAGDDAPIDTFFVPTPENASLFHILKTFTSARVPILVLGKPSSGRRKTIQHFLRQLQRETFASLHLPTTPAGSVEDFKYRILRFLESKSFCLRTNVVIERTLLVFADDVHLAPSDDYEAIPIQEAIREAIQQREWVDTENISKIRLDNVQFLAGASLAENGESCDDDKTTMLDTRCLSCFSPIVAESQTEESTKKIFSSAISHFLKEGGFVPDIFSVVAVIVNGIDDIYRFAQKNFTKTLEQPHYNFSFTTAYLALLGLFHTKKEAVENKRQFLRLWVHEMFREFCDRLTKKEEIREIYEKLIAAVSFGSKENLKAIFDKYGNEFGDFDFFSMQQVRWGIFGNVERPPEDRYYEELPDEAELHQSIISYIRKQMTERGQATSDIVIFKYVVEHLTRACRILCRPGGNLLLVGDGGCGRKSLTKLSAYILGYHHEAPQINPFDDYKAIRNSLKKAMLDAALEEEKTVVVIGDDVLRHPKVLHIIHTILSTGYAPGILSIEDSSNLIERLRLNSDDAGILEEDLWALYVRRVKDYVHLVITPPPVPILSRVLALYPAISKTATIDFYQSWPKEALAKVGEQAFSQLHFSRQVLTLVVKAAINIHDTASKVSQESGATESWCPKVTPASYLHFLQEFQGLYKARLEKIESMKHRYTTGLEKLDFAASQITVMKEMLATLGPQIEKASQDVSTLLAQIEQESADVESNRTLVSEEEEAAEVGATKARELQEECKIELSQALPALQAAAEALNTLKPADISLVKSMKNPPQVVKMVMSAVCVMMDVKPDKIKNTSGKITLDFWGPSKRLLGDMYFLQQLKEYDKENISEVLMDRVNKEYLALPEFNPAVVAKASSAAEGLCRWVQAISEYYDVAKIVAPKRARLMAAEGELQVLLSLLEEKRNQLRILEEKLETLQKRYTTACKEKKRLETEKEDCSLKLDRAEKLIRGLGGERHRWETEKAHTEEQLRKIPGDSLLAAASLAYLAPHPPAVRETQTAAWTEVIEKEGLEVTTPFSIVSVLASPLDLRAWNLEGLPADTFSSENAIFIKHSVKCPMLVDPDDQGTHWLERHERSRGLVVVRAQDANSLVESLAADGIKITILENALAKTIPYGKPLLLKDLHGEPPPLLQPLLQKCIVTEAGIETVKLGSLQLRYQKEFRLYLATRQVRPNIPSESKNNITLINFTVTLHGLSDLLRQVLVQHERPELEDERERLATAACDVQRRLLETEAKILSTLAAAQGNILESEEAIKILQEAKQMSDDLKQKEAEGTATEEAILECCKKYEAVSRPGARLYLLVSSLPNLSNIYQFSLTWFMQLYVQVIKDSGKSSVLERRLKILEERLMQSVHHSVIKSLGVPHRLPFSVMLALHALRLAKTKESPNSVQHIMGDEEQAWFLQLSRKLGLEATLQDSLPSWVPQQLGSVFPLLQSLEQLTVYKGLTKSIEDNLVSWLHYLDETDPDVTKLPKPWNNLHPLFSLILMSVICRRQIVPAAYVMVSHVLGPTFGTQPTYDLAQMLLSNTGAKNPVPTNAPLPLLLVTVPGVDALEEVMRLANKRPDLTITSVSLGQGQEQAAESAVTTSVRNGGWVILQNVHHAKSWLPRLARIVNELNESYQPSSSKPFGTDPHPEFRLILTTQPTEDFPVDLLRHVEKIAVSPPVDAKAGLVAAVDILLKQTTSWGLDDMDMEAEEASALYRLLYSLSVFHVLVSERGRHGKRAWAAAPTFTHSDLVLSLTYVRSMLEADRRIEPDALEHIIGRIIYGGRIKHSQDEYVILSLLREVLRIAIDPIRDQESSEPGHMDNEDDEDASDGIESLFPDYIAELSDLTDFVKKLNCLDNPELFGLPRSVKSVQAMKEGEDLLIALTNLAGSVEEFSSEEDTVTALLVQTKDSLPHLLILDEKFILNLHDSDMADILHRETDALNSTIKAVKITIENSILLLKTGNCRGKEEIAEDVVRNIPLGRTPSAWSTFHSLPTPQILQSFLNVLLMRAAFFQKWISDDCPSQFWLGGFQFLPAFLALILRQCSIRNKVPLHVIEWKFAFTEDPPVDPSFLLKDVLQDLQKIVKPILRYDKLREKLSEISAKWRQIAVEGLHVYGLWLAGASWDEKRNMLCDSSNRQMIQLLPILKMVPTVAPSSGELTERELRIKEEIIQAPEKQKQKFRNVRANSPKKPDAEEKTLADLHLHLRKLNSDGSTQEEDTDDTNFYQCPVYEGSPQSSQSPVIFKIPLPAGPKGSNHWVQRRVAIYTSKI